MNFAANTTGMYSPRSPDSSKGISRCLESQDIELGEVPAWAKEQLTVIGNGPKEFPNDLNFFQTLAQ